MATWSQVLLDVDGSEHEQHEPLFPTVERAGVDASFTPLFALTAQAKYFDDRLMVRVEQLAHESSVAGSGLLAALEALRRAVPSGPARGLLDAARHLLGHEVPQFGPEALHAERYLRAFELDEKRSKPLGVWAQSPRLRDLFRHDRLLQEAFDHELAAIFRSEISNLPEAREAYARYLALSRVLSGPPTVAPVTEEWSGDDSQQFALLPAADSHESRLVRELFTGQPVPRDFKLANELMARIRDGRLDTTPREESSWYEHQQHAAAALLSPQTAGLTVGERYQQLLDDAFKALFAINRETHVKQLDLVAVGGGYPFLVAPEFSLEPLPEHYARLARGYRALRHGLRQTLGALLVETAQFEQRAEFEAPRGAPLDDAIRSQELLFRGAELVSRDELGQSVPDDAESAAARIHFRSWQALSPRSPALTQDLRVAAPVYFDLDRKTTRVAVVLGLRKLRVEFEYTKPPRIEPLGNGKSPTLAASSRVVFSPVTLECDLKRIPNREELRALCDRERSPQRIRDALESA